jgi:hypothetical protein
VWVYRADGAILHACAVGGGKVVFGDSSGKIDAVNADDGKLAWSVQNPLTPQATERVSQVTDEELDRFIWQNGAAQQGCSVRWTPPGQSHLN